MAWSRDWTYRGTILPRQVQSSSKKRANVPQWFTHTGERVGVRVVYVVACQPSLIVYTSQTKQAQSHTRNVGTQTRTNVNSERIKRITYNHRTKSNGRGRKRLLRIWSDRSANQKIGRRRAHQFLIKRSKNKGDDSAVFHGLTKDEGS